MNQSRTFGVEIEMLSPISPRQVANLIQMETGIECREEYYNHSTRTYWKIVTDSSVRTDETTRGYQPMELVSPPLLGDDGLRQIEQICAVLNNQQVKASVNKTCGLHVHVDATGLTLKTAMNLLRKYAYYEKVLDMHMAPSRRGAGPIFCRGIFENIADNYYIHHNGSIVDTFNRFAQRIQTLDQLRGINRYCKVNLASFWKHGTVEFRHHHGTVDAAKITNWVRACMGMYIAASTKRGTREVEWSGTSTHPEMSAAFGIIRFYRCWVGDNDLSNFYKERAKELKKAEDLRTRRLARARATELRRRERAVARERARLAAERAARYSQTLTPAVAEG